MKILQLLKANSYLTIILVLGFFLRIYHIDYQSVWLDEIHTLNDANPAFSISEVYSSVLNADQHPPLYFYCIHILFKIFGYTPIVARLFSAFIGIASIYAMYKLGKELLNKEIGIISALLMAVNGFHIYHSQDARPYAMLCLFTIVSFIYLIKFIKLPTVRNSIFYGIASALMLYGHFFALFGLLSQLFILGFFLILSKKSDRKAFFVNCLISGLIMLVLYIPSFKILIAASKIKEFWIPMPTADAYTLIFKEFFGNSEMVLCVISLALLLYVVRISKETPSSLKYTEIVENKVVFTFVLLMPWIVIVLLVPLIRSYLSIPMIISRYFINLLPALLILIALGIYQFKNQIFRWSIIGMLCIFTLVDTIIVKKYYTSVSKTQFREVTQFLIDNNKEKDTVVTSLRWYYSYFLQNDEVNMSVIDKNLEDYVNEMRQNQSNKKSFWYTDAHGRPYKLSETAQKFVDRNFIIDKNIDLVDAWAKHFVANAPVPIDLSKYNPLKDKNGDMVNFNVENFTSDANEISMTGWAYIAGNVAAKSNISLVLISNGITNKFTTQKIKRDDVTAYFKSDIDISDSGFSSKIDMANIEKGNYRIGIMITNKELSKEGLVLTDKFFTK